MEYAAAILFTAIGGLVNVTGYPVSSPPIMLKFTNKYFGWKLKIAAHTSGFSTGRWKILQQTIL